VAGVVRSAPPSSGLAPGARVAASTLLGGFAEVAQAVPQIALPLPDTMSFAEGAGLVVNYHTAVFALSRRGRLQPGDRVVVHGAAGGVGTAAVQVARGLGAQRVAGVVSSEAKAEVARRAGAEPVMAGPGWVAAVRDLMGAADVVFDPIGGERLGESLRVLAPGGRLLSVGFAGGEIPSLAVNRLLLRNADVVGVNWGGFVTEDPEAARAEAQTIARLAESGHIRPVVGSVRPLEQAAEALADIAERRSTGKVVLEVR
jgi:NADPH2:quinone reductase